MKDIEFEFQEPELELLGKRRMRIVEGENARPRLGEHALEKRGVDGALVGIVRGQRLYVIQSKRCVRTGAGAGAHEHANREDAEQAHSVILSQVARRGYQVLAMTRAVCVILARRPSSS